MIATREWVKDLLAKVLKKNNEKTNNIKILYQGACGISNEVQLSDSLENYKIIRLEICTSDALLILNSVTIGISEFIDEKLILRSHWNDMSKIFYQDIAFLSNNTISINCNSNTTTAKLIFRVIVY